MYTVGEGNQTVEGLFKQCTKGKSFWKKNLFEGFKESCLEFLEVFDQGSIQRPKHHINIELGIRCRCD